MQRPSMPIHTDPRTLALEKKGSGCTQQGACGSKEGIGVATDSAFTAKIYVTCSMCCTYCTLCAHDPWCSCCPRYLP